MKKLLATLIAAGLVSTASAAGVHVEDGWARSTVRHENGRRVHEDPQR